MPDPTLDKRAEMLRSGAARRPTAQPGDRVTRGQTLLTIESMKIEHQIAAPRDGALASVAVAPGQQVGPGQVLVIFEAEAA